MQRGPFGHRRHLVVRLVQVGSLQVKTVDDVTEMLRSGALSATDVPINVVVQMDKHSF